jgi:hypothetical protein
MCSFVKFTLVLELRWILRHWITFLCYLLSQVRICCVVNRLKSRICDVGLKTGSTKLLVRKIGIG